MKPTESAGSDGIKLWETFDEAKEQFDTLMNKQMPIGTLPRVPLWKGTTAYWIISSFIEYYGMKPVNHTSKEVKILIYCTRGVLDAVGNQNGPSRGEIMMTSEGPCLVEMKCRAYGLNGILTSVSCRILPQVDVMADAFFKIQKRFSSFLTNRYIHAWPRDRPSC